MNTAPVHDKYANHFVVNQLNSIYFVCREFGTFEKHTRGIGMKLLMKVCLQWIFFKSASIRLDGF